MTQVAKTEAIKNFLAHRTHPDLAARYDRKMEVQVLAAPDGGTKVEGEYRGKSWSAYTDGVQTWKSFRMPLNANTEPVDNDGPMNYDLAEHAEGVGMTGWNWDDRLSLWFGFDFDAMTGHSERHLGKLTNLELRAVEQAACAIPWVTVRKSTSGKGIHLYVFVNPYPTANHTEHAALSRAILGQMSALAGFDFRTKVDAVGGNMWVWHRKMSGTDGLTLIKQGEILAEIPANWRDHIDVVTGRRRRTLPAFVELNSAVQDDAERQFDELSGQHVQVKLDPDHHKLIAWLRDNGACWTWNTDQHMMITHTSWLKEAHEALQLRGTFETLSTGRERGSDQNCFAYPLRRGGWAVRRYTPGVAEAPTWSQDGAGWTRCYLNREPDLATASKSGGAVEDPAGGFVFHHADGAKKAAFQLGADVKLAPWAMSRRSKLKEHKDGRLIVEVAHESTDNPNDMQGWFQKGKTWQKIYDVQTSNPVSQEMGNYDDMLRHVVTEQGENCGWVYRSDQLWRNEPMEHLKPVLKSALGLDLKDATLVLGSSVDKPWTLVNRPFQPEYTGDRTWNRNAAQLRFAPSTDIDNLSYPTWSKVLDHIGKGLDEAVGQNEWCQANGVLRGADYLKIWIASLFQEPAQPLPYLFLYSSEQNTGKSILHEGLSTLVTRGVSRADAALISQAGFNAELETAVLCVIEETDLRRNKGAAYQRIKDWVTSIRLPIHKKGHTPYDIPNTTHFIQTSNDANFCPIFNGDTRITMIQVSPLEAVIPKRQMLALLEKEAPDFMAAVLGLEIPPSGDRLNVPVIATEEKLLAERSNQSMLELFLSEKVHNIDGEIITVGEFYNEFKEWLDPGQAGEWTKIKVGREMPPHFPKGRRRSDAAWCWGNISWAARQPGNSILPKLVARNEMLVSMQEATRR